MRLDLRGSGSFVIGASMGAIGGVPTAVANTMAVVWAGEGNTSVVVVVGDCGGVSGSVSCIDGR